MQPEPQQKPLSSRNSLERGRGCKTLTSLSTGAGGGGRSQASIHSGEYGSVKSSIISWRRSLWEPEPAPPLREWAMA